MQKILGLIIASTLITSCTTTQPTVSEIPNAFSRIPAQQEKLTAGEKRTKRNFIKAVTGKFIVDTTKCSEKVADNERLFITYSSDKKNNVINALSYSIVGDNFETDNSEFSGPNIRLGQGKQKTGGGYGGEKFWNTKLTANSLASETYILQKRKPDAQPQKYFEATEKLELVSANRIHYVKKSGTDVVDCYFDRAPSSETQMGIAKKIKNAQLQKFQNLLKGFSGDLDQMSLELAQGNYKKNSQLTDIEIKELLNLHMIPHVKQIELELVLTAEAGMTALKKSLDKLVEYANDEENTSDKADYAPLMALYKELEKTLSTKAFNKEGRLFFVDWGNGGDSMGQGLLFIDEKNKQALYIGNGDYI